MPAPEDRGGEEGAREDEGMTVDDLVDAYMRHVGMRRIAGHSAMPILPFLLLDVVYTIFNKDIKPVKCHQQAKLVVNGWVRNYNEFNRDFFRAFTPEQRDVIIDMMDDFEEHISNHVTIARVAVMNGLPWLSFEEQRILASAAICHVLAHAAQVIWGEVYRDRMGRRTENRSIAGIEKYTFEWTKAFAGTVSDRKVDLNNDPAVNTAVSVLCRKIIAWLHQSKLGEGKVA